MSDTEGTLTKPKKPRTEKQIAATTAMRAALQKKKEEQVEQALAKGAPSISSKPTPIEKKLMLQALKHKLNNSASEDEEEDVITVETNVVQESKAPRAKAKAKQQPQPEPISDDEEEEIIIVKKQKKPKKKTIIVEESESEDDELPTPRHVPSSAPSYPTRNTRSQQNKYAKIGFSSAPKEITSFFMD